MNTEAEQSDDTEKKSAMDVMAAGSVEMGDPDEEENEKKRPPDLSDITPLGEWIVVWPAKAERYQGKIYVPEGSTANPNEGKAPSEGEVLLVGDKVNPEIKVGMKVHFWKHAGSWEWVRGKQVRVVREVDIFGYSGGDDPK